MRPDFIEVDGTIIGLRHVVTVAFQTSGSAVLQLTSGNVHVTESPDAVAGLKRYFLPQPPQETADPAEPLTPPAPAAPAD